ncbi:MAG: SGNH/GDSL hydrolase family protein [Planctomycetia bacterium]|nr:SGNH/GDSL hydrolase family protein [Planctomycetia bacterium]
MKRWMWMLLVLALPLTVQAEWFETRSGLENCRRVFEETKKGTVAFVGGSITEMHGWREKVCEELQKRFPDTEFEFIAAGISSTGSTPGAFRLTTDVFTEGKKIDLLFEEAAVNDSTNFRTPVEILRGMEGIVRHARRLNPEVDIVMMYFAEPSKSHAYRAGKTPEVIAVQERVAEHYGVPSINLAKEVTDRIDAGEFTWEKDFRDLHPAPFGHQLYANTIARLFDACWESGKTFVRKPLPEPLDPFSYFNGHYVSIDRATGWDRVENWQPPVKVGTRRGFVNVPVLECVVPGKVLTFPFRGTAVGIFVAAGPDTGIVEYSVDGAPWKEKDFYTPWSRSLYLPWAQVLEAELPAGEHLLKLRMSEKKNPQSSGTAIRIVHFLEN